MNTSLLNDNKTRLPLLLLQLEGIVIMGYFDRKSQNAEVKNWATEDYKN